LRVESWPRTHTNRQAPRQHRPAAKSNKLTEEGWGAYAIRATPSGPAPAATELPGIFDGLSVP